MSDSSQANPGHPWRDWFLGGLGHGTKYVLVGHTGKSFGRRLSIYVSLLSVLVIWIFFFRMRGWVPPAGEEVDYSTYVNWMLFVVLGIQMIILVATIEGGHRGEVLLDTLTSGGTVGLIVIVLFLHTAGYEPLPREQMRYAISALFALGTDFVVDLAVALLAQSRMLGVST